MGVVIRGAWGGAVVLLAPVLSCGEVRLVDPRVDGVPASGVVVDVGIHGWSGGTRLEFQGYVYGYEGFGTERVVRYLDAGSMAVGDRVAERINIRAGEPIYRVRAQVVAPRAEAEVRIGGSEVVPGCRFDIVIPVVRVPEEGAVVRRDRDLALPLAADPAALAMASRMRARIVAEEPGAGPRWVDLTPVHGMLVVPGSFLSRLGPGGRELKVRLDLERTTGDSSVDRACAPFVVVRSWYDHRVRVRLE